MTLTLYNTLSRKKQTFRPLDWEADSGVADQDRKVRMYVCGPTVYDYAHIGNARPVIVFDVLYRLLCHLYGADHVAYVRNITDVDDKINARAVEEYPGDPLNDAIRKVTSKTENQFHDDVKALGCLPPNQEPHATGHIEEMKAMIKTLIDKGFAYEAEGHVLFRVGKMADYGKLSGRTVEDMIAGARVEVAPYKEDPMDFVLWKPSSDREPGWESEWSLGRPGWHIECSAMSHKHLGTPFDIHGGGIDLTFPHHENEIAQSRCCFDTEKMAKIWMHNGYLQVEGKKMSKSDGNFITINEMLNTPHPNMASTDQSSDNDLIRRNWNGLAARMAMLLTNYRQPLDWTAKRYQDASDELRQWYELLRQDKKAQGNTENVKTPASFLQALEDDLNTSLAITELRRFFAQKKPADLLSGMQFLGLLNPFFVETSDISLFAEAKLGAGDESAVQSLVDARLKARAAKDWAEADRIRDQLVEMGIQIQDGKNPETGEAETLWEVKK